MKVPHVPEGLEAVVFTADGDMRQALNNLQATFSGFEYVNQDNVFKVRIRYSFKRNSGSEWTGTGIKSQNMQ